MGSQGVYRTLVLPEERERIVSVVMVETVSISDPAIHPHDEGIFIHTTTDAFFEVFLAYDRKYFVVHRMYRNRRVEPHVHPDQCWIRESELSVGSKMTLGFDLPPLNEFEWEIARIDITTGHYELRY